MYVGGFATARCAAEKKKNTHESVLHIFVLDEIRDGFAECFGEGDAFADPDIIFIRMMRRGITIKTAACFKRLIDDSFQTVLRLDLPVQVSAVMDDVISPIRDEITCEFDFILRPRGILWFIFSGGSILICLLTMAWTMRWASFLSFSGISALMVTVSSWQVQVEQSCLQVSDLTSSSSSSKKYNHRFLRHRKNMAKRPIMHICNGDYVANVEATIIVPIYTILECCDAGFVAGFEFCQ